MGFTYFCGKSLSFYIAKALKQWAAKQLCPYSEGSSERREYLGGVVVPDFSRKKFNPHFRDSKCRANGWSCPNMDEARAELHGSPVGNGVLEHLRFEGMFTRGALAERYPRLGRENGGEGYVMFGKSQMSAPAFISGPLRHAYAMWQLMHEQEITGILSALPDKLPSYGRFHTRPWKRVVGSWCLDARTSAPVAFTVEELDEIVQQYVQMMRR